MTTRVHAGYSRERASDDGGDTLWVALAERAAAPIGGQPIYTGMARRLALAGTKAAQPADGVYTGLAQRTDLAQYRPSRAAGVVEETLEEDGQTILVLRSPTGSYVRLTVVEAAIWRAMDGSQTVVALATMAFLQFQQLVIVTKLAQELRRDGFLADPHVGLYSGLQARQANQGVEGWGRRIGRALRSHELAISGIDAFAGALHRWGGWMLFTRTFAVILAALVLASALGFALVGANVAHQYRLIDAGNVGLSLVGLWVALLVSFVLHELAHAVAVKHFGRRVVRGGVMLYYGMPAAFVDTSDIWMAGRRARIIVSLAGPLCDLLVGAVAALGAALLPVGSLGEAAYRLAAASYLAAICNLNPLLELDGYYILSDWLRLPNLRRQALAFIGGPLWQKLAARAKLSHEERIYGLYGLLAGVYTVLAVGLALAFWRSQLLRMLGDMWARGDLAGRLGAVIVVVAVVVPVALGLLVAAWGLVAAAAAWVARRGYGRSPLVVAAALTLLTVALASLPSRYGVTVETRLIVLLLWLIALVTQIALHADYRGAAVAPALDAFLTVTVIELVAQLGMLWSDQIVIWSAFETIGFVLLLFAGMVALLDLDLRQSPPLELVGSAMLLALAFLAGGMAIWLIQEARPWATFSVLVLQATPVYTSVVALALLLPLVAGFHDSRLRWSWLLLWVGIGVQAGAYLLELRAGTALTPVALAALIFAAGLWAAAWCAHVVALRQLTTGELAWPLEPDSGEAERLQRAFRHTYAGLYRLLRAYSGARRARALDDRMDVLAATANWEITLDREAVRIGAELMVRPLDAQGGRFAEVLRYTVAEIERLAGATFARRAIQAAYDALPWPEREAADRRCFPDTPWARELSRAFGDARTARLRLLRHVGRFAACDDVELGALAAALEPRRVNAGGLIQGSAGLWIVEAGEVLVKTGATMQAELHRGAAFDAEAQVASSAGAAALRQYRASVDSDLLFLNASALARLLNGAAPHADDGAALATAVQYLERAPFFRDLRRETLRALAPHAEFIRFPPRTPLIRQGRPSGRLYVLVAGEVVVVQTDGAEAGATGKGRIVARLGPVDLFGELELLRGTLPVASVVAVTPVELLALPHSAVAGLLTAGGPISHELEQIGSGRLHALR